MSTNYAVLACTEFPRCQTDSWWPTMDLPRVLKSGAPLGFDATGAHISFQALTAIHFTHRLLAMFTLAVLAWLAWRLGRHDTTQRPARWLAGLATLQLLTGLSNVGAGRGRWSQRYPYRWAGAMVVCWCVCLRDVRSQRASTVFGAGKESGMSNPTTMERPPLWSQFYALTKPRVVQLIVFSVP